MTPAPISADVSYLNSLTASTFHPCHISFNWFWIGIFYAMNVLHLTRVLFSLFERAFVL